MGIVKYHDYETFVVADIPGLIEGASKGKGLGLQFLRHIERTKALVFMIDVNSEDLIEEYNVLCSELEKYNKSLLDKPKILFITKTDSEDMKLKNKNIPSDIKNLHISSINNYNIDKAVDLMYNCLNEA